MFFSRRQESKLIMLLEVQSCLIRGSLMLYEHPGAKPKSLSRRELEVELRPETADSRYADAMMRRVSEAVEALMLDLSSVSKENGIPRSISEVHYVLSSPWVISQAKTLTINFDKDTSVTSEKLSRILADERVSGTAGSTGKIRMIEEKVFDVRLNGYSIPGWEGKYARSLEVSYSISFGGEDSISRLGACAERVAPLRKIFFHSSLLLQYASLQTADMSISSYILVHAHGELTDVVAVKNGSCSFFGSYPIGIHGVIRSLGHILRSDRRVSESTLSLYFDKRMEHKEAARAGDAISRAISKWSASLAGILRHESLSPVNIFVIARAHPQLFISALASAYPAAGIRQLSVDMPSTYASAIALIKA